jgi:CheY-like chemotaxis protein
MNDFDAVEILLAEDSETDAEMTIRALQGKNLTNRLVRVKDGAEALDFISRRGVYSERPPGLPMLLLLDLKMPKVDGIEVLREVKAAEETRSMPVVS